MSELLSESEQRQSRFWRVIKAFGSFDGEWLYGGVIPKPTARQPKLRLVEMPAVPEEGLHEMSITNEVLVQSRDEMPDGMQERIWDNLQELTQGRNPAEYEDDWSHRALGDHSHPDSD